MILLKIYQNMKNMDINKLKRPGGRWPRFKVLRRLNYSGSIDTEGYLLSNK